MIKRTLQAWFWIVFWESLFSFCYAQARTHPLSLSPVVFIQGDSSNADYADNEDVSIGGSPDFTEHSGNSHTFDCPQAGQVLFHENTGPNGKSYFELKGTANSSGFQSTEAASVWTFLHSDDNTVIAFLKLYQEEQDIGIIVETDINNATDKGYAFWWRRDVANDPLSVRIRNGSGTIIDLSGTSAPTDSTWITLAAVFDDSSTGNDAEIYQANQLYASQADITAAPSQSNPNATLTIGYESGVTTNEIGMDLALLAIYDYTLSNDQLTAVYNWINCEYLSECGNSINLVRRRGLRR